MALENAFGSLATESTLDATKTKLGDGTQKTQVTNFPSTQAISGTVTVANPSANPETGLAKDGTDISAPTAMPAGGAGIRGWLSAIWTKLNGTIAVSGPLTDTQIRATALPVSGTVTANGPLTDTQLRANPVPVTGSFSSSPPTTSTTTASSVAGSTSVATVLASNTSRKGATIYNDSAALLYLHLGSGASATVHTAQLGSGGYYEVPFGYTGVITGLWVTGVGAARVVEFT